MATLISSKAMYRVITVIAACSLSFVTQGADRPNVLILIADDLGWNDVGYHGSEISTPNIDQIAQAGIELDRFYTQPSCSPTRAALMTGKSPASLGVIRPISKNSNVSLPLEEKLMPEYLADLGYQSFLVGKWHLGKSTRSELPNARGFEHAYGSLTGGIGYWSKVHGGGYDWHRNGKVLRQEGYATHLLVNEVNTLLENRDKSRPNFMYVAFQAPHLPNEAPVKTISKYDSLQGNRSIHAAMVDELDQAIGKILQKYKELGILENTIILFMSDNGGLVAPNKDPALQSKMQSNALTLERIFGRPIPVPGLEFLVSAFLDGASDNSPLPGGKTLIREGGVRVPAAIWFAGHLEADRYTAPFTVSDVLPTILEGVGAIDSIPNNLRGRSQWQGLLGGVAEAPDYVISGFIDGFSIYHWPWKLINSEKLELFHIINDPLEKHNLATEHTEIVADLQLRLDNWGYRPDQGIPWLDVIFDPDTFGGEENRAPWVESIKE
jgi:arylsulfatase A-like enzyme